VTRSNIVGWCHAFSPHPLAGAPPRRHWPRYWPHVVAAPLPMQRLVLPFLALVRKLPSSPTRSLAIKGSTPSVTHVAEPPSHHCRRHLCSRRDPPSAGFHRKHVLLPPPSCTNIGPTLACLPCRAASSPE
jgi:hypothetical protein